MLKLSENTILIFCLFWPYTIYFLFCQYFYGISSDVDAEHAGKLIKVNAKTGNICSFSGSFMLSISVKGVGRY
jgi:hypothetical protein